LATGATITPTIVDGPPAAHTRLGPSLRLRENVEWIERDTIRRALERSPLKRQAAELMGITPRALSHYLAKYRSASGDLHG
jgi:transcriptional regulator with GAF, ATPase, and Fis domain